MIFFNHYLKYFKIKFHEQFPKSIFSFCINEHWICSAVYVLSEINPKRDNSENLG